MRLPNGYGGIRKLSGKRRRPYQVTVTVGWELVNGRKRQIQKTIGYAATKAEALNLLADYNINPIDVDKSRTTFSEVWEKWLPTQEGYSKSKLKTIEQAYNHASHLMKAPISQITSVKLQEIIDELNSNSYQVGHKTAYKSLFDYALAHGYVKENIALDLRTTAKTKKPVANIFTAAEKALMPSQYDLFFYTGLREKEMLAVTVDDIDHENEIIRVKGTKTDNAFRYVPVHPAIRDMVMQTTNRLWRWDDSYGSLYYGFKQYSDNHKPHDMRKTFATVCYLSGVDDVLTKRMMGHAVSDITHSTYIKNDDILLLRDAMSKVDYACLK